MRSLQLLSVLVTTCLPTAFAQIIDNTGTAKVITESGAILTGQFTIQDQLGNYMTFKRVGPPHHDHVELSLSRKYATVNISYHSILGSSGRRVGRYNGIALGGENKCAATQFGDGRDKIVVPYACIFDKPKEHSTAKLLYSAVPCGYSKDALSLAQKISGASKKTDFKFTKANSKSVSAQKSGGTPGPHVNSRRPTSQRSSPGSVDKDKRHRGRGPRRGGRGGHGRHGHKGGNHKGGNHKGSNHKGSNHKGSNHKGGNHHGSSRRHQLAKRDSRGPMTVSPQGPVSGSSVPATGSGTPKQSASGASGRAGSGAGDHGPGPQSKAKKTQDGADSQQSSEDPDPEPASGEDRPNSEIAEALKLSLMSGNTETVCYVGTDHLMDMATGGLTTTGSQGYLGVKGLAYELFDATNTRFWFKMKKVG